MEAQRFVVLDAASKAAATYYYPTKAGDTGVDLHNRTACAIQFSLDANAVLTLEMTMNRGVEDGKTAVQQAASMVDITKSAKSLKTFTDGNASYTNVSDILWLNGLPLEFLRIKVVASAPTANPYIAMWVL